MCLPIEQQSYEEDVKRQGLENQGESVYEIPAYTFPDNVDIISPELIFCLMGIGSEKWKKMVSEDVLACLEELNIINRVAARMTRNVARDTLSKIYKRTVKDEDKIIIANLLRGYHIKGVPENPERVIPFEHNNAFVQERCNLIHDLSALRQEISRNLPKESMAPTAHRNFSSAMNKLSEYVTQLDSSGVVSVEQMQEIRRYFEEVKEQWNQEKN